MNQTWRNLLNKKVKEIRFVFCQTSSKGQGAREWIKMNLVELKKNNPEALLLIRECENSDTMITARYNYGIEKKIECNYTSPEEVEKILESLVKDSDKMNSELQLHKRI